MQKFPPNKKKSFHISRMNFRNWKQHFGIKQADRLSHLYLIGKTGLGKSTLLETLARQDFKQGFGFALIDPHGGLVERLAAAIPPAHAARVV
ncbi:MAG TPA: ATP-binding protein [Rhizomicrobium sp.]|jgi:type IV secretory pathway VirB4 component|nr:ATP-binding protein [Rhizomicrobium sp.]